MNWWSQGGNFCDVVLDKIDLSELTWREFPDTLLSGKRKVQKSVCTNMLPLMSERRRNEKI